MSSGSNALCNLPADTTVPAPPGIHWCLSPPRVAQSALSPDGHPARGAYLPPVALPRRMWAGGSLHFHGNLHTGDKVAPHSRIATVTNRPGRSGNLCFVSVDHEITSPRGLAITERQDIVYLEARSSAPDPPSPPTTPAAALWQQTCRADPVMLFRYSAVAIMR